MTYNVSSGTLYPTISYHTNKFSDTYGVPLIMKRGCLPQYQFSVLEFM